MFRKKELGVIHPMYTWASVYMYTLRKLMLDAAVTGVTQEERHTRNLVLFFICLPYAVLA